MASRAQDYEPAEANVRSYREKTLAVRREAW